MLLTLLLAMLMGGTNILALSSFGSIRPIQLQGSLELSPSVERMLRAYYGLGEEEFITTEMLDRITTLKISANKSLDGHILADFVVNGEEGYAQAVPALAVAGYWEGCIQPRLDSEVFDASCLEYFKNLREITFVGFTPGNYEFPAEVSVSEKPQVELGKGSI